MLMNVKRTLTKYEKMRKEAWEIEITMIVKQHFTMFYIQTVLQNDTLEFLNDIIFLQYILYN